jgi:hypothetical protein
LTAIRRERVYVSKSIYLLCIAVFLPATVSWAQLNAPNEAGVALGHIHMVVKDVEAEKKVWIAMGGQALKVDDLVAIKFPGVLVLVEKGTPSGNNAGAAIDHPGFLVQNGTEWLNKVEAAGVKVIRNDPARLDHGYVYTSEDMRIEINPAKPGAPPIACDHIHYNLPADLRPKAQAWYIATFGAKPPEQRGPQGPNDQKPTDIAGISFRFGLNLVASKMLPSKGQTMDRIGFEIKDLEAFSTKLEASGIKLDEPYSKKRHKSFASALITDPWGTSIEQTEGLSRF